MRERGGEKERGREGEVERECERKKEGEREKEREKDRERERERKRIDGEELVTICTHWSVYVSDQEVENIRYTVH